MDMEKEEKEEEGASKVLAGLCWEVWRLQMRKVPPGCPQTRARQACSRMGALPAHRVLVWVLLLHGATSVTGEFKVYFSYAGFYWFCFCSYFTYKLPCFA